MAGSCEPCCAGSQAAELADMRTYHRALTALEQLSAPTLPGAQGLINFATLHMTGV